MQLKFRTHVKRSSAFALLIGSLYDTASADSSDSEYAFHCSVAVNRMIEEAIPLGSFDVGTGANGGGGFAKYLVPDEEGYLYRGKLLKAGCALPPPSPNFPVVINCSFDDPSGPVVLSQWNTPIVSEVLSGSLGIASGIWINITCSSPK